MTQRLDAPDARAGAYYVTIRRSDGATIYALGPFQRHRRALGLVDCVRRAVSRAGLDPWADFGYGTARVRTHSGMPAGAFNATFHVGPNRFRVPTRAQRLAPAITAALDKIV